MYVSLGIHITISIGQILRHEITRSQSTPISLPVFLTINFSQPWETRQAKEAIQKAKKNFYRSLVKDFTKSCGEGFRTEN